MNKSCDHPQTPPDQEGSQDHAKNLNDAYHLNGGI